MRLQRLRLTRVTYALSKKLENFHAAQALHFVRNDLARVHRILKVTPAMEAGISGRVWNMREIIQ
jgi:hypothetical protein